MVCQHVIDPTSKWIGTKLLSMMNRSEQQKREAYEDWNISI
jgi:hypothetical protein